MPYGAVIVQTLLALGMNVAILVLYRHIHRRLPLIGMIVATGILLRATCGVGLFWISYSDVSFLSNLHDGDGFWGLAPDARSYFRAAVAAVENGPSAISSFDASPAYTRALALWMLIVGVSPASSVLLNLLCYLVLCSVIVSVAPTQRVASRSVFVPLVGLTFSPALVVFGTQPLKDTFFAFLVAMSGMGWLIGGWPASNGRLAAGQWRSTSIGVGAVAVATYLIAGIRAYFALFVWISAGVMFVTVACQQSRAHLRRYAATSVAALLGLWLCFMLGAGPYYTPYSPSALWRATPAVRIERARDEFVRTGGATNIVSNSNSNLSNSNSNLERELRGLATLFVPVSVLRSLSLVDFQGGRGLLLITDLDTIFFDLLVCLCLVAVFAKRADVRRNLAPVCFLFVLAAITTVLLAYVVTNYGTFFRLRLMVAVPIWMLPVVASGVSARSHSDVLHRAEPTGAGLAEAVLEL